MQLVINLLFPIIGGLLGATCYFVFLRCGWEQYHSQSWQEVDCTILSVTVGSTPPNDRSEATYSYTFNEKSYKSKKLFPKYYALNSGDAEKKLCQKLSELRTAGKTVKGYVNPQAPEQALLSRGGVSWKISLVAALMAFLIPVGSASLFSEVWLPHYRTFYAKRMTLKDRKPWHTRLEWIAGSIRSSSRRHSQLLLVLGCLGLPLIPPCVIECGLALSLPNPDRYVYLGYLFPLLPAGAFALGAKYYRRWRRYGDSVLRLVNMPGVIGGRFVGHLQIDKRVNALSGFHTRLRCMEVVLKHSRKESEKVLWETEQTITRGIRSEENSGTIVPIVIHLPYGLPCTEESNPNLVRRWLLTIKAMSDGEPYSTEFEVPIFLTEESNPHYVPEKESIDDQAAEQDSLILLEEAGIAFEEVGTKHHLRFTFPKNRDFEQNANFFLLLGIVYAFVFGIAHYFDFGFSYFLGIVELLIFYCLLDLFLFHSVVEVEPGKLTIWRGWFYLGQGQEISAEIIGLIDTGPSLLALTDEGNVSLHLTYTSGAYTTLAKRVGSEHLAKKIIQMIDSTLRIERREILP